MSKSNKERAAAIVAAGICAVIFVITLAWLAADRGWAVGLDTPSAAESREQQNETALAVLRVEEKLERLDRLGGSARAAAVDGETVEVTLSRYEGPLPAKRVANDWAQLLSGDVMRKITVRVLYNGVLAAETTADRGVLPPL